MNVEEIKEKLDKLLFSLHPEIDFTKENALIDDGILDSFDIVELVTELNEAFDISINASHLLPENFNSTDDMAELIIMLKEQSSK